MPEEGSKAKLPYSIAEKINAYTKTKRIIKIF